MEKVTFLNSRMAFLKGVRRLWCPILNYLDLEILSPIEKKNLINLFRGLARFEPGPLGLNSAALMTEPLGLVENVVRVSSI